VENPCSHLSIVYIVVYTSLFLNATSHDLPHRIIFWGCVKRFFTALRAELCFDRHVIFAISLREIAKMTCLSKEYSAAAGSENLFTQPQMSTSKYNFVRSANERLFAQPHLPGE
jgi:hypothetical protein